MRRMPDLSSIELKPIQTLDDLPGQATVVRRREPWRTWVAAAVGALWPPLIITLLVWWPENWMPGLEFDWRLSVLLVGIIAVPAGIWLLDRERARTGRPGTRMGVIWRFLVLGGLLSAAVWGVMALLLVIFGAARSASLAQALGAAETNLLVFGVGALPIAVIVGLSYAFWAGLCVAFIAYEAKPMVRDRLGVMGDHG